MSLPAMRDLEAFVDVSNAGRRSSVSVLSFDVESTKHTPATIVAGSSSVLQIKRATWHIMQALAVFAVLTLLALVATILYYELRPSPSAAVITASNTVPTNGAACTDYYSYTCSSWLAANPLGPTEYERQMTLGPIQMRDSDIIEQILNGSMPSSSVLRTYFESCMDTDTISTLSWTPLQPYFEAISNITDVASYMAFSGRLLQRTGQALLVSAAPTPDPVNPNITMLLLESAGLTFPNPLYYEVPEFVTALEDTVASFFTSILNIPANRATAMGQQVAILEWAIAQLTEWPPTLVNATHFSDLTQLSTYNVSLDQLLLNANVTFGNNPFNVYMLSSDYFDYLNELFSTFDMEVLQAHAMWTLFYPISHLLDEASSAISFQLQYRVLLGQEQQPPRDQYCQAQVNKELGGLVDAAFINATWSAETRQQVDDMITQLRTAFSESIQSLYWMDEATKNATALKLQQITAFVGGRPIVHGSESLTLSTTGFLDNYLQLAALQQQVSMAALSSSLPALKQIIGSGTDVNAAYYAPHNTINVYAGIVQPSVFNASASPIINLARIGVIIGHELSHGFDNDGRLFDGEGKMQQWWTNTSISNFNNQTQCLVDQYSSMFIRQGNSGGFVDGELSLGENIADFGGVHFAYLAYRNWMSTSQLSWTEEQLQASDREFFTAYGQLWCTQSSPESLKVNLMDVHAPYPARINGPLQMFPPFAEAYGCPVGTPMNPSTQCFVY